jgi:multidrug efflux pump
LPDEDQGVLMVMVSCRRARRRSARLDDLGARRSRLTSCREESGDRSPACLTAGFSFAGAGQNQRQHGLRPPEGLGANAAKARTSQGAGRRRHAGSTAPRRATPSPVRGCRRRRCAAGQRNAGFTFKLQDRGGLGHDALTQARNQLDWQGECRPTLERACVPNGLEDRRSSDSTSTTARPRAGLSIGRRQRTLSSAMGGSYVNDFIDKGA